MFTHKKNPQTREQILSAISTNKKIWHPFPYVISHVDAKERPYLQGSQGWEDDVCCRLAIFDGRCMAESRLVWKNVQCARCKIAMFVITRWCMVQSTYMEEEEEGPCTRFSCQIC